MTGTIKSSASPYPGLRPFRQDESALFFGRGQQVADMLVRLEDHRFLAVVGASGCGKSSLVRAGLLPALQQGYLATADECDPWYMVVIRPGDAPLRNLAQELVRTLRPNTPAAEIPLQAALVHAALRGGPKGLVHVAQESHLEERSHVLILVDQFEELFRFRQQVATPDRIDALDSGSAQREEAAEFVALLLATAAQSAYPIHVVITMRSDFMGDCDAFHGLPEAINESQFLTPRLTRDQAQDAVVEPGRTMGGDAEPALVNRILNQIGNSPDQLPLMQHVLMRLWNRAQAAAPRNGESPRTTLRLCEYECIGELDGALDKHADEIFDKLTPGQQRITQVLFRCLSDRNRIAGTLDVRRPTKLQNIADVAGVSVEQVKEVAEVFRRPGVNFLTPPSEVPLTPETPLDVGHESLLRHWKRLRKWVDDESQSAATYRRLEETAQLWKAGDHDFLDQAALTYMQAWKRRETPNDVWAERYGGNFQMALEFLDKSKQQAERQAAEEREARKKKQWLNKMYWITGVASIGIVVAIGLIIWLIIEYDKRVVLANELARQNEERAANERKYADMQTSARANAEKERDTSQVTSYAFQVTSSADRAPQEGVLFAWRASEVIRNAKKEGRKIEDKARSDFNAAIRKSLSSLGGLALYGKQLDTSGVAIFDQKDSPNKWLVTSSVSGNLHLWEMWNGPDRDEKGKPKPIEAPKPPILLDYDDGPPRKLEIAGRWLVVQTKSGKLRIWDLCISIATSTNKPTVTCEEDTWDTFYFSPHRNVLKLRFPSNNKTPLYKLWDLRTNEPRMIMLTIPPVENDLDRLSNFLSFTPDGRWFTLLRESGMPIFWDLDAKVDLDAKAPRMPTQLGKPAEKQNMLRQRFNGEFTDNNRLVVCYSNGGVRIWERQKEEATWGIDSRVSRLPTTPQFGSKEGNEIEVFTDLRGLWAVAVPKRQNDGNLNQQSDIKTYSPFRSGSSSKHQAELFDLSKDLSKPEECRTFLDKFQDVDFSYDPHPIRVHESEQHMWLLAALKGEYGLWDLKDRDPIAPQTADAPGLYSRSVRGSNLANLPSGDPVRFSPEGRWLLQASTGNYVVAWDLWSTNARGEVYQCILRGHDKGLADFRLSGDGRWLMTLGLDNTLRAWDMDNLSTTVEPREIRNPVDPRTLDVTPNRDWLAVSRQDGTLRLWNPTRSAISTLEQSHTLGKWAKNEFASLQFSEDGNWLLVYRKGGEGFMWDLRSSGEPQKHCALGTIPDTVVRLIVSRESEWVAVTFASPPKPKSISPGSSIRLWRVNASKEAVTVQDANGVARAFDESCRRMIVETAKEIEIWALDSEQARAQKTENGLGAAKGSRDWTLPVISPDGKKAVVLSYSADAILWNLEGAKKENSAVLKGSGLPYDHEVFISANGRWLVFKGSDNCKLWDLKDPNKEIGRQLFPKSDEYEGRSEKRKAIGFRSLIVSPNRRWLLVIQDASKPGGGAGFIRDLEAEIQKDTPLPKTIEIESAAFSTDSRRLITTTKDTIHVWDLSGPKGILPSHEIEAPGNKGVMNAAIGFTANGSQNAPVAFSPDARGRWLAIAGRDRLIRVWDREKKGEPTVLHGPLVFSPFVLFVTPGGERVISVDLERRIIRVYTVSTDGFLELAKRTVGSELISGTTK